jgi:hypothetical protein
MSDTLKEYFEQQGYEGVAAEKMAARVEHEINKGQEPAQEPKDGRFDQWCLVEIMGHQQIVGRVTETTLAGGAFLRVDVPAVGKEKAFTRLYSPGSIYCISPISEEVARKMIARETYRNKPVSPFDLPQLEEANEDPDDGNCAVCGQPGERCQCDPEELANE